MQSENFVAAVFTDEYHSGDTCDESVLKLVALSENLKELGILMVQVSDKELIDKLRLRSPLPALGFYRNGDLTMFDGNVDSEVSVIKFLTSLDSVLRDGAIEEVDVRMLEHVAGESDNVFVFMYDDDDGRAHKIIRKLEGINDNLENDDVVLLKCSQEGVDDEYGVGYLPRLVHMEMRVPVPYVGDLSNEGDMLRWIADVLRDTAVKEVTEPILIRLLNKVKHVAVVFFDSDEFRLANRMLTELQAVHDELVELELPVVKISLEEYSLDLGLKDLPSLLHFTDGVPNVFLGKETRAEMLDWLVDTMRDEVVEEVTPEIIQILIEEQEYVGVLYTGGEESQEVQQAVTGANEELAEIGIKVVKTKDREYPYEKHEIQHFPSMGLYRNGLFLQYDGSFEKDSIEKWFTDIGNLKIDGRIEEVNDKTMFYLYENDDDIVVLFYESSDRDVDELLEGLETIDEKLDRLNISLVKIDDDGAKDQFGITELPALVYIQSGIPNVFGGDLFKPKGVLGWVKHEANTTRIHEVSDIVLSKLVSKFHYLAAIFYTKEDDTAVKNLQTIAARCLDDSIAIVKLHDEEEARRLGIAHREEAEDDHSDDVDDDYVKIVYFQRGVPSLVRADTSRPSAVLEWLVGRKRYPTIEEVTDRMLDMLVASHEFVAVFFQGDECDRVVNDDSDNEKDDDDNEDETQDEEDDDVVEVSEDDGVVDCDHVLAELEQVDDQLDEIGILMVTTKDHRTAEENGTYSYIYHCTYSNRKSEVDRFRPS